MSSSISELTDESSSPPIRKTGTSTSKPHRKPHESPNQPTNGMTSKPGSTHRAPIEKPIDRARGGMANESEAITPGPTITRAPATREWATTVRATVGANANPRAATAATTDDAARIRKISGAPFRNARVVSFAPINTPRSSTNCTGTLAMARWTSVRPKVSAY